MEQRIVATLRYLTELIPVRAIGELSGYGQRSARRAKLLTGAH